jgi:hypothetical protein
MLRHRFPIAKPDRRRRTAAELAADRPRSSPRPSLRAVNAVPSPLSLVCRPTPQRRSPAIASRGWVKWAESTPARSRWRLLGQNSPPAQLAGEFLLFFFSLFFSHFHIYI